MKNPRRHSVPLVLVALALFASASPAATADAAPRKVAILVWDGVELLDFAGPGEVFEAASHLAVDAPAFDVFTIGPTIAPIVSQGFLEVVPNHAFADSPRPHVLIVETVPPRRTLHLRFDDLADPQPIPRGTDFASVIESDVPIVVQHTRLDSRQAENALMTTIAFAGD